MDGDGMVTITLDYSAMIFYRRHPEIERLLRLEEEGKIRLYHAQNLSRDLASLNPTEEKIYDRLREMVFGRKQEDLNLADHGDLVLLINHMKSKRDFFLTMDKERYASLRGHGRLDIRFPDEAFVSEVEGRLLGEQSKPKARKMNRGKRIKSRAKTAKKAESSKRGKRTKGRKAAKARGKSRKGRRK